MTERTVTIPVAPSAEMIKALREGEATNPQGSRKFYERIGWLHCALDAIWHMQNPGMCACGERIKADCPGAWEQGCDLGNNEAYCAAASDGGEPQP